MKRVRRVVVRSSAAVLVLIASACGGDDGGSSEAGGESTESSAAGSEEGGEEASGDKVEILFWDQFADANDAMEAVIADFEAANPNIDVTRESYTLETMTPVLRTALDSGQGPDLAYFNLGPADAGVLANAGLIQPLDDAYAQYGWDDRIYSWTKARSTYDGQVYGVGNELEFLGVYYNTALFEENGWAVPTSWEDFLSLCGTISDSGTGIFPTAFSNGPGWPVFHQFSMMMNNQFGRDGVAELISGDTAWDNPDTVASIQRFFVDANEAGCFPPEVNALAYEDGNALLRSGEAAMLPTGTWQIGEFSDPEQTDQTFEMFFLPPVGGGEAVVPGGLGSGWIVSSSTEHPDEVMQFIDFLISEEMGPRWITEFSRIPAYAVDTAGIDTTELNKFAIDIVTGQADTMGYNIDVLTPAGFNAVLQDGLGAVIGGSKSPEDLASELQDAMDEAVAAGEVIDITP
jgi:raffinose/stachyose/melibiose transport system substrate-binding protein